MDTWVRTATVAIASLVAGFLLSQLLGDDVVDAVFFMSISDVATDTGVHGSLKTEEGKAVNLKVTTTKQKPDTSMKFSPDSTMDASSPQWA